MSSKSPGPGAKRKQLIFKVLMLDDSEIPFQIESKTTGNELINLVYQYLKLIESDYFGLEFIDQKGKKCWLDYDKSVSKQVYIHSKLIFCVKFYTPDPGQLEEEYTRYLYALQIKRDLAEGLLLCSDATASLLVSYILQAEVGDYVETYKTTNYFQNKKYFPHQNEEHEAKILDYFKNHIGQSPADADLNLLDIARKIELYGIIMHPAKDHECVQLNLAVAHMGILVFQNFTKINTFSWAKIRKLSFKRKKFLVKLHPENYGFYKDTVEFYFDNRDDSKNFWKKCIEHHSFFRCISAQRMPRQKSKLLTRGSSFRYYGRTQKELIENARENFGKNRSFDRSYHSMRSISQYGGGGGGNAMHITGTQSLNRNLASRSTGAILVPTNGCSSGMSSSESVQHFHTYNQNQSSSAHHLSYIPNPTPTLPFKSSTLQSQHHIEKPLGFKDQNLGANSSPSLVANQNIQPVENRHNHHHQRHPDNDSSTHGSRTIDSRYSRDKTLGLSDDDAEEDDDEEDEADEDEYGNQCTCGQKHENELAGSQPQVLKTVNYEQLQQNPYVMRNGVQNQNTSSFKQSSKPVLGQNLVTLPIQQQTMSRPGGVKKIEILNNTDNETSNSGLIHNNPNKIYSRKEVITTYKEETKNTHLEEFHQTTTFYDPTFRAQVPSPPNNKLKTQASPSTPPLPPPSVLPLNVKSTTTTTTTTLTSEQVNTLDKEDSQVTENVNLNANNNPEDENDFYDDANKNDRCSLAAKIIYSNLQKQQMSKPPINIERIKRPSSLIKPLNTQIREDTLQPLSVSTQPKQLNYNRFNNRPALQPKPNIQLIQSVNNYQSSLSQDNADSEDKFPTPPPIPSQLPHQHNHGQLSNKPQPVMLQDYQQPIASGLRTSSINDKFNKTGNYFHNVEDEFKKKKIPLDESYCIVKELVMTERTYKKDLDLLTYTFRQFAVTNNIDLSELLLFDQMLYPQALEPIQEFHTQFLRDLEIRLFHWTDKNNSACNTVSDDCLKIGDLLQNLNIILRNYRNYIDKYEDVLNELEQACKRNKKFDSLFKDFESQKICYLPFTMFLLKPIQRLIHYKILFERLLIYYGTKHHDYHLTYIIFEKIDEINELINEKLPSIENKQKLIELHRDLIGMENFLSQSSKNPRYFLREGSLQKLSRKGYQQRMFFLFNDMLLYCARSSSAVLQFKIHGEYQLKHVQVEDGNPHINIPNSFTIYSSNRSLLVSAVSQDEKSKWIKDLYEAIEKARHFNDEKINYSSIKSNSSSENNLDVIEGDDDQCDTVDSSAEQQNSQLSSTISGEHQKSAQQQQHRANTTMHVCWHRNTSVSAFDNHKSIVNQLSGYLLRKFKNSNGWQKLWVVFTNFCLFFYKTYQDEFPLASLPLLGYTITIPNESDNINKDFVFKLQFKNHVYFFRSESQYSYDRWLEVIESAAQKQCLYNPND